MEKSKYLEMAKDLLQPMGYTITPLGKGDQLITPLQKATAEKYSKLSSRELEEQISELAKKIAFMQNQTNQIRETVLNHMNKQEQNELTKHLYAGPGINKGLVKVESAELQKAVILLDQLKILKGEKIVQEMTADLRKDIPTLIDIKVKTNIGMPQLKITVK